MKGKTLRGNETNPRGLPDRRVSQGTLTCSQGKATVTRGSQDSGDASLTSRFSARQHRAAEGLGMQPSALPSSPNRERREAVFLCINALYIYVHVDRI